MCRDSGYVNTYYNERGQKVSQYGPNNWGPHYCQCSAGALSRQHDERLDDMQAVDILETRKLALEAGLVLPARCREFTLDSSIQKGKEAYTLTERFLDSWDGKRNLLYSGPTGVGKTGLMVGVLRNLQPMAVREGWQMRFISSTTLFKQLQAGFEDKTYHDLLDRLCSVYLLAIDDIGAEQMTDWKRAEFLDLFNQRYEAELPTFVTTNFSVQRLEAHLTERTVGRLIEHCATILVDGPNYRLGGVR